MKVQGRDCTLTVAKDNEYYPLPYSEETVRQTSKGYVLPGCIGTRNREKLVETGKTITGCDKSFEKRIADASDCYDFEEIDNEVESL